MYLFAGNTLISPGIGAGCAPPPSRRRPVWNEFHKDRCNYNMAEFLDPIVRKSGWFMCTCFVGKF